MSLVVAIALLVMPNPTLFYLAWMVGILLLLVVCLIRLFNFKSLTLRHFSIATNVRFTRALAAYQPRRQRRGTGDGQ